MIKCNLSRILGEKRISQSELAKITGMSRSTISNLYNEKTTSYDRDVLEKICGALNITIGELLEYQPKTSEP